MIRRADDWKFRPSDLALDVEGVDAFRNVTCVALTPQRDLRLGGVAELVALDSPKARALARCILLRTGQWPLDMRREVPSENSSAMH